MINADILTRTTDYFNIYAEWLESWLYTYADVHEKRYFSKSNTTISCKSFLQKSKKIWIIQNEFEKYDMKFFL